MERREKPERLRHRIGDYLLGKFALAAVTEKGLVRKLEREREVEADYRLAGARNIDISRLADTTPTDIKAPGAWVTPAESANMIDFLSEVKQASRDFDARQQG